MEFFERHTFWDHAKRFLPKNVDIRDAFRWVETQQVDDYSKVQMALEYKWVLADRPYYSVYSSIAKMLVNTTLDLDCSFVKLPIDPLLIRFSKDDPLKVGNVDRRLRSILVGEFSDVSSVKGVQGRGLGLWCDRGESTPEGLGVFDFQTVLLAEGITVEESITRLIDFQNSDDPKALHDALRVVIGVCLMANDPDIIVPDVLSKDKHKPLTNVEIERARRRGKIGWIVGEGCKVQPHVRKPHFAIRWTGKGRTIPVLRPIKGCIVHRKNVQSVPTGFMQ